MIIEKTLLPEVLIIQPKVFEDSRGFFMETWNKEKFSEAGLNLTFVQDNHSRSIKNTLRGLHYQLQRPQGKLIRVSLGEIFDVVVDLRKSSPNYGKWIGQTLNSEKKQILWIPPGFAHGFLVLSDAAEFQYKCTDFYNPAFERCIRWNDDKLDICWPLEAGQKAILSDKDQKGQHFEQAEVYP